MNSLNHYLKKSSLGYESRPFDTTLAVSYTQKRIVPPNTTILSEAENYAFFDFSQKSICHRVRHGNTNRQAQKHTRQFFCQTDTRAIHLQITCTDMLKLPVDGSVRSFPLSPVDGIA